MTIDDIINERFNLPSTPIKTRRRLANEYLRQLYPGGLGYPAIKGRWYGQVRARLVQRAGMQCHLCGLDPTKAEIGSYHAQGTWPSWLQVDHVTPLELGGEHHLDNMRLLCSGCNNAAWTVARSGGDDEELEMRVLQNIARRTPQRQTDLPAASLPTADNHRPNAATRTEQDVVKWFDVPLTCGDCRRRSFRPFGSSHPCSCGGRLRCEAMA